MLVAMRKKSLKLIVFAILLGASATATTQVQKKEILEEYPNITDTSALGLKIAQDADARDKGFKDSTVNYEMTLISRNGSKNVRLVRSKSLEVPEDGDKSISIFDNPKDVKGTVFLTHSHKSGDDDQWLYLPALKRVKRISSSNKSGPFMGSEFAYEDLASQEVEKYTYNYLRKESCGDLLCYVIEYVPVDKKSGYSKQIVWLDTKELRSQKIDYYDKKKSLLKTLTFSNYHLYLDKHWRPHTMHMVNKQNKKQTILAWSDFKFKTGLREMDFTSTKISRLK